MTLPIHGLWFPSDLWLLHPWMSQAPGILKLVAPTWMTMVASGFCILPMLSKSYNWVFGTIWWVVVIHVACQNMRVKGEWIRCHEDNCEPKYNFANLTAHFPLNEYWWMVWVLKFSLFRLQCSTRDRHCSFIDGVDLFDNKLFGLSLAETKGNCPAMIHHVSWVFSWRDTTLTAGTTVASDK